MGDFAEAKSKAAHIDMAFAICQTVEEKRVGKIRLVWVVDRHFSMEWKQAGLVQDYHIGQFCKRAYEMKDIEEGEKEEEG